MMRTVTRCRSLSVDAPLTRRLAAGLSVALAATMWLAPRSSHAAGQPKPILAVFDIYDARPKGKFSPEELKQLDTYLLAKLAEAATFQVVPREQVVAAISSQKKDTYKACYDEKCQIELGKELAAEKSLGTQLIRIGDRCVVTSTLYDLKTAVSERAATKRSTCDQAGVMDALDAVVDQLSGGLLSKVEKNDEVKKAAEKAEKELERAEKKDDRKEPEKKEPDKSKLIDIPQKDRFANISLPSTPDGNLCAGGDNNACSRVAKEYHDMGQKQVGYKAADRGCNLACSSACQWAAKMAQDEGEKDRALGYAHTACNLAESEPAPKGGGCSWTAKLESEYGSKAKALEAALTGCNTYSHGGSCAWAANLQHAQGTRAAALEHARRGCSFNDGEACSWVIKINYDDGNRPAALEAAKRACDELKHAGSCSWASTISYEGGEKAKALDFSTRGCELGEVEACGWNTKILYELGNKQRALEVGARACNNLNHAASCSWAASIEYELNNKSRALAYATRGCSAGGNDACSWKSKIEGEGVR